MSEKNYSPHEAIDYIFQNAPTYGKAKGRVAEIDAAIAQKETK